MENCVSRGSSSSEFIELTDDLQMTFDGKESGYSSVNMPNTTDEDFMDLTKESIEFTADEDHRGLEFATNAEKCSNLSWISDYGVHPTEANGLTAFYERIDASRKTNPKIFDRLDAKILCRFRSGCQTNSTYNQKMMLHQKLEIYISKLWPAVPISLVVSGSTVNGCASNNADLDMCLCVPDRIRNPVYNQNRGFATKQLKMVRKKLFKCNLVSKVMLIAAKVPILRILCKKQYEGVQIDLNVNNLIGIHNSHLLHHYSRLDDRFPMLCFAVKKWARAVGISDAALGMFNSYSLNLMVLHFLQVASNPPVLPNLQKIYPQFFDKHQPLSNLKFFSKLPFPIPEVSMKKNNRSVGELLMGFFDYFSKFNYSENAISIRRGKVFPRSELSRSYDKYFVYIEEPFDGSNTARCVTGENEWLKIQTEILRVRNQFSVTLPCLGELPVSPTVINA